MTNAALVNSARGLRHLVTPKNEDTLEELFQLLERLRARKTPRPGQQPPPQQAAARKVLTLPEGIIDWYVSRDVGRPQWFVESDQDEWAVLHHLTTLHDLRVPTFLREDMDAPLMKLFFSLDAMVSDGLAPADEAGRSSLWGPLKEGLVRAVVQAASQVSLRMFGDRANLVAVFDASGYSPSSLRWKVSFRICFVEIAVTRETAERVRNLLAQSLTASWPEEIARASPGAAAGRGWAAALEPPLRGGGRDAPARLWDAVLDARAYHECAKHRLVWCDTSAGSPPCPEGRPLRPYALLNVTAQPDGKAALQRVRAAADLCGAGWARLGSPWTAAQVATPYRDVAASREGVASRYPSSSDPLAADGARGGGGPGANGAHAPAAAGGTEVVWNLVVSPDGEEYYHNVLTDETAWDPPPGARVVDGRRTR